MIELRPGVWHWTAPHPQWTPDQPWPREVSSYAVADGGRVLLFDPLAVPAELLDRERVVVLTAPWHERDARRLGAPVFTPPRDSAEDLIRKYGITAEQAGDGSPDITWLQDGHHFGAGDRLELGIDVFPGREHNDVVLWLQRARAVIAGDTLVDFGRGLQVADWLREDVTHAQVADGLRPLLDLPVELVLPAHGPPAARGALERALAVRLA